MSKVEMPNTEKTETPTADNKKGLEGKVVVKKKKNSLLNNVADEFVNEEPNYIKEYILGEVVLPAVKDLIANITKSTIDMLLYGDCRENYGSSSGSRRDYNRPSRDRRDRDRDDDYGSRRRRRNIYNKVEDIVFEKEKDAIYIMNDMRDELHDKGEVSVAYLNELLGERVESVDTDYGWYSLKGMYKEYDRRNDEWHLYFPRPQYLD